MSIGLYSVWKISEVCSVDFMYYSDMCSVPCCSNMKRQPGPAAAHWHILRRYSIYCSHICVQRLERLRFVTWEPIGWLLETWILATASAQMFINSIKKFYKALFTPGQNDTFAPVVSKLPGHVPLVPIGVGAYACIGLQAMVCR